MTLLLIFDNFHILIPNDHKLLLTFIFFSLPPSKRNLKKWHFRIHNCFIVFVSIGLIFERMTKQHKDSVLDLNLIAKVYHHTRTVVISFQEFGIQSCTDIPSYSEIVMLYLSLTYGYFFLFKFELKQVLSYFSVFISNSIF